SNSGLTSGSKTFGVTLKTTGSQTMTATDTVSSSVTGGVNVTVTPASAASLTVSAPSTATAAVAISTLSVTAEDSLGTPATGYTGTVRFTTTNTNTPILPSDYAFQGSDSGTKTFSVTLKNADTHTVTATDTSNGGITGTTGNITVSPASASVL